VHPHVQPRSHTGPPDPPGGWSWRRNQFAVTTASFIGFTGFTLVMPFLPIYISQLGVGDMGAAAAWAGLSLGVTPALTAVLSPLWGRVADRFGRKLMVERSLLSFVAVMAAMAFVTRPWHVLALRAIQGLFAGYGALTLAMAAESAPRDRMASAIGMVQTAQRLGPALGPVIGGAVAGLVGLRRAFFVTSFFYAAAFLMVLVMYREPSGRNHRVDDQTERTRFRDVLGLENFALLMGVIFGIQIVDRSLGPILPLHVEQMGVEGPRVPLVSGVLFSVVAGAAALGHHSCGRLLKRFPARIVIVGGAALTSAAAAVFTLVPGPWVLGISLGVFGVGVGAAMTAAYTAAGLVIPAGVHGTAFGMLSGAALAGLALSPIASGLVGSVSIRAVFVFDVVAMIALAGIVRRAMVERAGETRAPVAPGS
jgi:MFS transporter, DHA1 family, multidrug resistance protein